MNTFKIYDTLEQIEKQELNNQEKIKLIRELLYKMFEHLEDDTTIHLYYVIINCLDIFSQMIEGRKFDKNYLKHTLKF